MYLMLLFVCVNQSDM